MRDPSDDFFQQMVRMGTHPYNGLTMALHLPYMGATVSIRSEGNSEAPAVYSITISISLLSGLLPDMEPVQRSADAFTYSERSLMERGDRLLSCLA